MSEKWLDEKAKEKFLDRGKSHKGLKRESAKNYREMGRKETKVLARYCHGKLKDSTSTQKNFKYVVT